MPWAVGLAVVVVVIAYGTARGGRLTRVSGGKHPGPFRWL